MVTGFENRAPMPAPLPPPTVRHEPSRSPSPKSAYDEIEIRRRYVHPSSIPTTFQNSPLTSHPKQRRTQRPPLRRRHRHRHPPQSLQRPPLREPHPSPPQPQHGAAPFPLRSHRGGRRLLRSQDRRTRLHRRGLQRRHEGLGHRRRPAGDQPRENERRRRRQPGSHLAALQRRAAQQVHRGRRRQRGLWQPDGRADAREEPGQGTPIRSAEAEDGDHVDGNHQGPRHQGGHRGHGLRLRGDGVLLLRHGVSALCESALPSYLTAFLSLHPTFSPPLRSPLPFLSTHQTPSNAPLTTNPFFPPQEDVLRLVELSEDLRRERRERIRAIEWERAHEPEPEPERERPRRQLAAEPWDEERIYEREIVYDRPPPPPMPPVRREVREKVYVMR